MTKKKSTRPKPSPPPPPAEEQSPPQPGDSWDVTSADDVADYKAQWLWESRLAMGTLNLIEGRKQSGKSSILTAIAADVTGGPRLQGGRRRKLGSVIWYGVEEPLGVIRTRLALAGCPRGSVWFPGFTPDGILTKSLALPLDRDKLQRLVNRVNARLIVIDPITSAIEPGMSLKDEVQGRQVLEPIISLATETGCCVVIARHLTKGNKNAYDAGLGGSVVINCCRSALRCDRLPEGKSHVLSWVAHSFGDLPKSIAFGIEAGSIIQWQGESKYDAETLSQGLGDEAERDESADAENLLLRAVGEEWRRATAVINEAALAGVGARKLREAKAKLRIPSRRKTNADGAWWEWGPPPKKG